METHFTKMQGAGNDFVVLDERAGGAVLVEREGAARLTPAKIAALADRRLGIGFDQLILLQPAPEPGLDAFIRFFNRDGSESGACGNGTRCAAALIAGETGATSVHLRGIAGLLPCAILGDGQVRVDLGQAGLDWRSVPLSRESDTLHVDLGSVGAGLANGDAAACSVGNPHATLVVADLDRIDVAQAGAALEQHPLFSAGANIGFAQVLTTQRIRLAVWERGSGLTLACGSGACAAVVNAHRRGLVGRDCAVEMPGGLLHVTWREDGHVLLAGPTATVFAGRIRLDP